jgi:hypothetical protein
MTNAKPTDLLVRARERGLAGRAILDELGLFAAWSRYGRPVLVGATANDLGLDPDIDLEVYCPHLSPAHGFEVLARAARNPSVKETLYQNHLDGPDGALYWRILHAAPDGEIWKIDMWSAAEDYALPRGEHLVGPLGRALTPERRLAILELKDWRARTGFSCLSIDLYRAVVADGVRDAAGLAAWVASHETGTLSDWRPDKDPEERVA